MPSAVKEGFEPSVRINYARQFSKLVDSASLPPHLCYMTALFFFLTECKDKQYCEKTKENALFFSYFSFCFLIA